MTEFHSGSRNSCCRNYSNNKSLDLKCPIFYEIILIDHQDIFVSLKCNIQPESFGVILEI